MCRKAARSAISIVKAGWYRVIETETGVTKPRPDERIAETDQARDRCSHRRDQERNGLITSRTPGVTPTGSVPDSTGRPRYPATRLV